ncbi:MipA/OmpV family protein [Undibacterium oligocarboniphilum]|uniref:MipA/OmpV family protein n=1 Tax=Undibacterium oligocarboniphilum TaxID=666702 RepID=A0A850QGP1_9BURK|nr:MipA/OmpV family protein [Undibacterium oligocarboniphilum]MBC3870166.1 MipA/OmpV family protein [Undibacterium oligocarboniphilum]NVO78157.1 MipA/OmpV family protein [Undibacterium oligocarboniphilum]
MKRLLGILLLAGAVTAQAQTADFVQIVPEYYLPKDVNFSLGAAALYLPKYKGSDEHRVTAYPLFDGQWKNGAFFSAVNGLGYNFSKIQGLQYGLRMSLEAARDESRSTKLHGLGDVNTALEPGAFLNYSFTPNYSLLSSLRYGSGIDHNGLQISLGGRISTALNSQHRLSATIGANWANSAYQQSYFGVTPQQSLASGYAQYTPTAGLTDIRLHASWHWNIDTNWSLTTGASISRLSGDAAKSPFVFDRTPVTVYSAASYRF